MSENRNKNIVLSRISVDERLPNEDGWYDTNLGLSYFNINDKSFTTSTIEHVGFRYWMEETTLPTDEDIRKDAIASSGWPSNQEDLLYMNGYESGFISGAEYVNNLIKFRIDLSGMDDNKK